MKALKTIIAAALLLCTATVFAQSKVHTYYVFVTAWGNGAAGSQEQENGSDGVVYVTNVFTVHSKYSVNKAAVQIQFGEEFVNRYGRDRGYIYKTNGVVGVWSSDSYDEAAAERRRHISDYVNKGAKARYMNNFEFFED